MFRCTECNEEYSVKPDFCDCGNDVFEEINAQVIKEENDLIPKKRTFGEMYPGIERFKKSLDPISVIVFSLCIILSILSLIFIGNKAEVENILSETNEVKQIKIKDIDEFWDDTPVKVIKEQKEEILPENKEKVEIKIFVPKINQQKNVSQKTSSVKAADNKAVQKTVQNKTQAQTKPKTASQTKSNTATPVVTKPKPAVQKPAATANNNVQLKPTISNNQTGVSKTSSEQNAQALRELKIYKNSLRNLLFSKINFAQIEGDGTATVSFKIENNGKLTGKAFVQRSNNEQLDDAIFYSLNTTPSYKAPPSAYKGETLKFKVKFVGGQYEVSLN